MSGPVMVVVAGPSGSGKSAVFPVAESGHASFNVDDRCRELHGSSIGIPPAVRTQAQAECEAFIAYHTATRSSFAVETTLRSDIAIRQAATAKAAGFATRMIFVATPDVELNVRRVIGRALLGGHSAPPDRIREIYAGSLANLRLAIAVFDNVLVYDNGVDGAPARLVCEFREGKLHGAAELPAWLRAAIDG
ncbi:MAG TPA: zeta toxin family protein [Kofleriaceae bacterium]|nr:zeta toxin family protein [Kofleriaceae bacterium]